jgi:hypothetical protein
MSSLPGNWARPRRILVVANETCAAQGVVDEVRYRAGEKGEVLVVAPALARTRLEHWLTSDLERRQAEAGARLDSSIAAFSDAGLSARGHLGDADPLQALDDALRIFEPDEVVISTHPHHRSSWLERNVVRRARERYDLPITHVVVDLEHERTTPDADTRHHRITGGARRVRLFHASDYDEAMAIQSSGFRDRPSPGSSAGVWLTDRPPVTEEAGDAWVVFAVDVPEDVATEYERGVEGDARRYFLPAELLNRHGPPVAEGDWSE